MSLKQHQPSSPQLAPAPESAQAPAQQAGSFNTETAAEHQGGLGNQGVQDEAFGASSSGGQGEQGRKGPETDATSTLDAALAIAAGQTASFTGPAAETLLRMAGTLHHPACPEEMWSSGKSAVAAAEMAREQLSTFADEVWVDDSDWVESVYEPQMSAYVVAVKAEAVRQELAQPGCEGAGALMADLAAIEARAADLELMLDLAAKHGVMLVANIALPMAGQDGHTVMSVQAGSVGSSLKALRAAAVLAMSADELAEGMTSEDAALTLKLITDGVCGVVGLGLRAGEALSMNLGAVEMASSFASVAKTFSRGAGAVGAALSLVDLGVQVAKAVKTGEVTPEMMERMAKDVIGIASGIAAFAGMATLAGALSAVLATWEVSKALIAEMEGLQAVIIQGEMVETLEGLLADASAIATLHDQALLSACIGSGANEVEERLAYAKASDLIAADMQGPAASLLMKANGSRCDPIRDAINMVFAMHGEQAASGGFHVANLFATDLMMELEMLATDLPEHAEREAQKA